MSSLGLQWDTELDRLRPTLVVTAAAVGLLERAEQGVEAGTSSTGEFFDAAHLEMARLTLARARAAQSS